MSHSIHMLRIQIDTQISSTASNCPYLPSIWSYVRLLDSLYSLLQVNLLRDKDLENYLKRPVAHI